MFEEGKWRCEKYVPGTGDICEAPEESKHGQFEELKEGPWWLRVRRMKRVREGEFEEEGK